MLKGVNRQVVEIAQPESRYFEKILLFVKPEYAGLPQDRLSRAAGDALFAESPPPRTGGVRRGRVRNRLLGLIRAAACAGAGAGLLALAELAMR